jgi:hypothetical protein
VEPARPGLAAVTSRRVFDVRFPPDSYDDDSDLSLNCGRGVAERYGLRRWRRLLNPLVRALFRVGLGPRNTCLLTVQGRKSRSPALCGRAPRLAA